LENDDIVVDQQPLLALYVDIKIWVLLVEILDGHILQVSNRCDELPIYRRFLQSRMREQNENAISHGRGVAVSRNLNRSRAVVYF
jgi:hypothetical protein